MPEWYEELEALDFQTLIETDLPPAPFWVNSLLPKRGMLIYGGTIGIGKSLFGMEIGRALVTGTEAFAGGEALVVEEKANVLLIDHELGPWLLQDRARTIFEAKDADDMRERFRFISQEPALHLGDPDCVPALAYLCQKFSTNVLILDPISAFLSDENSNDAINKMFARLEAVQRKCRDLDLSIVMSHHCKKPPADSRVEYDPLDFYNMRGAGKFVERPAVRVMLNKLKSFKNVVGEEGWFVESNWLSRCGPKPFECGQKFVVNEDGRLHVRLVRGATVEKEGPRVVVPKGFFKGSETKERERTEELGL